MNSSRGDWNYPEWDFGGASFSRMLDYLSHITLESRAAKAMRFDVDQRLRRGKLRLGNRLLTGKREGNQVFAILEDRRVLVTGQCGFEYVPNECP